MAAVLARSEATVAVVDGRPRYHLTSCLQLLGRTPQLVAAREATELGFTPCAERTPAAVLISRSARGRDQPFG